MSKNSEAIMKQLNIGQREKIIEQALVYLQQEERRYLDEAAERLEELQQFGSVELGGDESSDGGSYLQIQGLQQGAIINATTTRDKANLISQMNLEDSYERADLGVILEVSDTEGTYHFMLAPHGVREPIRAGALEVELISKDTALAKEFMGQQPGYSAVVGEARIEYKLERLL